MIRIGAPTRSGIGELLTGPRDAIVEQHGVVAAEYGLGRLECDLLGALERDDVRTSRSDLCRPDDAALVVMLLDDRRDHASRSDAVAPHHEGFSLPSSSRNVAPNGTE